MIYTFGLLSTQVGAYAGGRGASHVTVAPPLDDGLDNVPTLAIVLNAAATQAIKLFGDQPQ